MPRAAEQSLIEVVRQSPPIDHSHPVDDAWIKDKTVINVGTQPLGCLWEAHVADQ